MTLNDVKVYAGLGNDHEPFASFRDLSWNNFNVHHILQNKEIGTIDRWGPFFRISFNLIIHSYVKGKGKQGWSSVLAFDKKPSIDLNKNGELRFFFHQRKYSFVTNVDLNRWYNISIEQKGNNRKVSFKKSEVQFGPTVKISCL